MSGRFGADSMVFTTANSDLHAIRRAPLNPMFSKRSIAKFEPVIREKLELMCKAISDYNETGETLVLSDAFNAYAGDIITQYCFGFSYNHLESPGFKENFHRAFMAVSAFGHLALQFPIMHPVSCELFNEATCGKHYLRIDFHLDHERVSRLNH
jgi:cytochrome P450